MAQTTDGVRHGIDGDPTGDAEKGAGLGAAGGAVTGAAAGAVAGPVGAAVGAVVGGLAGGVASGAAVAAVDRVDDDNTVSGVSAKPVIDNGIPGVQTGGHAADGTPDTRGITEKVADAVTGDRIDDKTGKVVR